jgi:hypothetical protein
MFEAYLLGCAVGLALSSLRFGLVFDLGMFTAWITERPDTPRVVSGGFMPAGSKQQVVVHYLEHVPADVGAAFIWLKNRDPERWRDVQNVEHVMGKYLISDKPMTLEEWASARATVINEVIDDTKDLPAPKKE